MLLPLGLFGAFSAPAASSSPLWVYIGTYTSTNSHGIYVSSFDSEKGTLSAPEFAAEVPNAGFLAVHPNRRFLYAVGEIDEFEGKPSGSVNAFRVDGKSGKLTLINRQPSGGTGPCHLAVDSSGKCALTANYNSGTIAALPIRSDGGLGELASRVQHEGASVNQQRQTGPHAHYIAPDPANRFVLACDLGTDKVMVYRFQPAKALLTGNNPPSVSLKPGAGPRHLAFHLTKPLVYVINELDSTVTVFAYDAKGGVLKELQTVPCLPNSFKGENTCAEIQIHPSGRFVYASNRGHDSLAIFSVDPQTGKLGVMGHEPTRGKTPRHFAFDPTGKWLLVENQDSNTIVVFRAEKTGKLTATGQQVELGAPGCLVFVPTSF